VIVDFVRKLREDSRVLEILGDGSQSKSYLHVEDCVDAVLHALRHFVDGKEAFEVYNVGSLDKVGVKRIAEIVGEEMGVREVKFRFTGGVDGGRGWRGDVKTMLLSVDRLLSLGWKPSMNSEEAVRLSCRELLRSVKET
jgi:UDP-glucose 4-epimerase